ncbi:MAG: tyrosine-protein phosphatase [Bacteroidaceae bacterium]|nr:tyrosine-protein phosphatase [Bacteroidaceae bacterium]
MKQFFSLILFAVLSVMTANAADVELTKVEDLTTQYFIMAYSDNGTYKSPYWTKGNNQNVLSPRESAIICNGKDYYYLLKAEAVTYKGEKVYRVSISNGLHELFPNGIGGAAYMNSAGWCFFAGQSEPSGKSHVYGQDADGLGVWRITYTAGKGFQFQCVGNSNYISYTMSNSTSANKYYWQCFAEGSLYNAIEALKVSSPYLAHNEMRKMLQTLAADKTNITCDDAGRATLTTALATAKTAVDAATTEDEILTAVKALRAAGCTFLNGVTLAKGYQLNATPLLINASFPCNNAAGWDGTEPGFQTHGNAEFYSKSYNCHQTMPDMPAGTYLLRMQGFQRSQDSNDKAMTNFLNGTLTQSEGYFYANDQQMTLSLITRDAQTTNAIGGTQYTVSGKDYWMPNSMSDANKYFNNGKYWNNLTVNHLTRGDLTIGLRCSVSSWGTWTCFDNFEIYYQGEAGDVSDVTYLITNPSFETGTTDGWIVGKPSGGGDVGAKKNEGQYATSGGDGDYIFNTWSISDSYAYGTPEQFVQQTLYDMKPGEYRLRALASSNTYSSVKAPVELYGNNYVTSFVPPSKTEFRETYEVTIYLMPSEPDLTIGMRSTGWFRADNFRLIYFGKTEDYEKKRRLSIANLYEEIASQATDRSSYDAVLNDVHAALMADEITDEEIARQNERLRVALLELVKTGTTSTGLFDLTALLPNSGTQRANNTKKLTTLAQTLEGMPAGHYTFCANALYRPTTMSAALELYEAGTEEHPAYIYIGKTLSPVTNIFDDARHAATSASDIYATIDGRSAPMTESTAMSAFMQGDYAAVVESDLEADGQLEVGFRINAVKKTDNWFLASRLQLLYGNRPDVIINKSVPAGALTPLCMPFELQSDSTCQLYAVGSILDGIATVYPVAAIHAGEPCVIQAQEDIPSFTIPAAKLRNKDADIVPLPWDGGIINTDPAHFTWTTTSVDGTKIAKAEDLAFAVCDPMDMDFTVNLENLQARRFLELEDYNATTSSHITRYNITPPGRRDYPNSVGIPVAGSSTSKYKLLYSTTKDLSSAKTLSSYLTDGKLLYVPNLIPQRTYYYEVHAGEDIVGKGQFHTDGYLRMIYAPSIDNIRDLGGWKTSDGLYIRYGRIYRGGELNGSHTATTAATKRLRSLGVTAEIDLRIDYEQSSGVSAFGFTTSAGTFYYANCMDCEPENLTSAESYARWKAEFNLIMKNLRRGGSIYFHCRIGADRTGLLSLMLEGLLGVPRDQSNKNYELTTLSPSGVRTRNTQDAFFNYFNSLKGATLQQKFNTFFVEKLGVSQADIDEFRDIMLTADITDAIEDVPAARSPQQPDSMFYDLSGRRIPQNAALTKGIYIQGGKKILVK